MFFTTCTPPTKCGRKPSPRGYSCREEAGWPVGKMIVVAAVVVVVVFCLAAPIARSDLCGLPRSDVN